MVHIKVKPPFHFPKEGAFSKEGVEFLKKRNSNFVSGGGGGGSSSNQRAIEAAAQRLREKVLREAKARAAREAKVEAQRKITEAKARADASRKALIERARLIKERAAEIARKAKLAGVSFNIMASREGAISAEKIRKEAEQRGIDISTRAREKGFIQKLIKEKPEIKIKPPFHFPKGVSPFSKEGIEFAKRNLNITTPLGVSLFSKEGINIIISKLKTEILNQIKKTPERKKELKGIFERYKKGAKKFGLGRPDKDIEEEQDRKLREFRERLKKNKGKINFTGELAKSFEDKDISTFAKVSGASTGIINPLLGASIWAVGDVGERLQKLSEEEKGKLTKGELGRIAVTSATKGAILGFLLKVGGHGLDIAGKKILVRAASIKTENVAIKSAVNHGGQLLKVTGKGGKNIITTYFYKDIAGNIFEVTTNAPFTAPVPSFLPPINPPIDVPISVAFLIALSKFPFFTLAVTSKIFPAISL